MNNLTITTDGQLVDVQFGTETLEGLKELRDSLEGVVFDCSTKDGLKQANAAKRECTSLRTSLESRRKELKDPLLKAGKSIDAEAKKIKAEIEAVEKPIADQIAVEKQRQAEAKIDRVAEAQGVIDKMKAALTDGIMGELADVEAAIELVDAIDCDKLYELRLEAMKTKQTVLTKLGELVAQKAMAPVTKSEWLTSYDSDHPVLEYAGVKMPVRYPDDAERIIETLTTWLNSAS